MSRRPPRPAAGPLDADLNGAEPDPVEDAPPEPMHAQANAYARPGNPAAPNTTDAQASPELPRQTGTYGLLLPDAAAALGCSVDTIRRRIRRGELAAGKDAQGRWRVQLDAEPQAVEDAPTADPGELAHVRAMLAEVTRHRDELSAELASRRREAEATQDSRQREAEAVAQERAAMLALIQQAQALAPRLHDPREYADAEALHAPDSPPRRRRWWQR